MTVPANEDLHRAYIALLVYKQRGEQALSSLRDEKPVDEFFRLLRRRDAAFHNFQALDAKAQRLGLDLAQNPSAQDLWQSIVALNNELAEVMEASQRNLATAIGRFHDGSQALRAYGGRVKPEERLRKSV